MHPEDQFDISDDARNTRVRTAFGIRSFSVSACGRVVVLEVVQKRKQKVSARSPDKLLAIFFLPSI